MKPPLKTNNMDDFQTPKEAIYPLLPYLKKDWLIWECACGKGNIYNALNGFGYNVIATDILQGEDFLKWQPKRYDCIITNPPYTIKEKFLERCYQLGKPFALLLPLTTFETAKRQHLLKKYGVQVIFFDKRIEFETPNQKQKGSKSWFATAWFTNWLDLPETLNFVKFDHPNQKKIGDY
jgi:hypothetical protein